MSDPVVIVGGGAIGSAVAYFLTREPGFAGRVVVIERDPTYQQASSALSASSIRQQFSTPINIALSRFGFDFLRGLGDVGLVERGYLFLASDAGMAGLAANHAVQRAHGADVALLTPAALRARFPWLAMDGLAGGSLGLAREGWFDGYALLQTLKRGARDRGADYRTAAVVGLDRQGDRIASVALDDGTTVACRHVVNAAGPWAARVAALAGIALPVRARRRCVFVIDCRAPPADCPLVIDPSGVWFRPEGRHFICGVSPPADRDPDDAPLEVVHDEFDDIVWPALARRVPAFEAIKRVSAWAGYYEYNTVDQNGIVGRHPDIANLVLANGFSGHGIQQSPAVGRAVAELVAHGRYVSLDLTPLCVERLLAGQPLRERAIV
ncbi:MAG: FAD-binding oxidoreductase [Proteobacteria bacterium]|nr:FAD-binding oxidoreductase [Pseudomonadota bacterium]